jgi:hypothetical protein
MGLVSELMARAAVAAVEIDSLTARNDIERSQRAKDPFDRRLDADCETNPGPTLKVQAENPLLRRYSALCIQRGVKPQRSASATRICLIALPRLFDWRNAPAVVRPPYVLTS